MTAAQFQAALVALPGIGPGNVAVTGTSLAAGFTVALQGALANTHGLELHHCYNLLSIRYNAPAGIAVGDVLVKVTRTGAGAGVAAVVEAGVTETHFLEIGIEDGTAVVGQLLHVCTPSADADDTEHA